MLLAVPSVDAGQVNVFPAEWRDVLQQHLGNVSARHFQVCDSPIKIDRIPMHDRADNEIEARCPEGLTFERPIADFASLMEKHRAFELVRGLTFVESGLAAPAQCRARVPFDHEERPLNTTQFPQRPGELTFLWRCRELLQDGRRHDGSRRDRRREMKKIVPVVENERGVDRRPDVVRQCRICIAFLERVELSILEVAPRCEPLADQGEQSEDVIAGAAGVGEVLLYFENCVLIE